MSSQLKKIRKIVEEQCDVIISSRSRKRSVADARRMYCYLAKKFTANSLSEIGSEIGFDHATVLHHSLSFPYILEQDYDLRKCYEACIARVEMTRRETALEMYSYHLRKARDYARMLNRKTV